jgi:putative ABC transport system ATP-binding protein
MNACAPAAPIISLRNLSRIYRLGSVAVVGINGVDLEVNGGDLVVLKGISGSGKSTLLSLLAGLDRPTGGGITVAGHDLNRAGERELTRFRRRTVGMVFQSFNLLPTLSVMENTCLPALLAGVPYPAARERATELLRWLNMAHRTDHRPSQLSGGEMQRTAIARALINEPAIILADEPTGNLDSRNGAAVIDLLAELNRQWQRTVVIATHSELADDRANRVVQLRDGRIVGAV